MAHTYVNNADDNYETIGFKGQMQQAVKSSTKNKFETLSHVYVESSTDVYEDNELRQVEETIPKPVQDFKIDTTKSIDPPQEKSSKMLKMWYVIINLLCAVVLLAALGLVFGILNFTKDQNVNEEIQQTPQTTGQTTLSQITQTAGKTTITTESVLTKPPLGTFPNPARSCVELRTARFKDGIYVIQPFLTPFKVFCDMTAAGGGWVLAATINENSFDFRSDGDSWFFKTSYNKQDVFDYQNWINTNILGTVDTCTRSDYKSQAYYEYEANDVMLRHVPNQTPLEVSREHCFLQYQTENGFMQNYGGNLHKVFNYHYPLIPSDYFYPNVNSMLDSLEARSTEITNLIPDFYRYVYGSNVDSLDDSNMFTSYGMKLFLSLHYKCRQIYFHCPVHFPFGRNCSYIEPQFEKDYRCGLGNTIYSSRKGPPFFALFAVGNFDHCFHRINFEVNGYPVVGGYKKTYTANLTLNNFFLHYEAQCRHGKMSASICDVWFYIRNNEDWKTTGSISPHTTCHDQTNYYRFGWENEKPISNMVFGYTLLSRKNGLLISETDMAAAIYKILEIIAESKEFCSQCNYGDDVLSVPVQFSIGNESVVDSMLPPRVKPLPTGFIQFRAFGSTGSVYALCPAVSVNDWRSKYVCIGGMNNLDHEFIDDCNDFTNWNGLPGTSINKTTPVDFAHSARDLNSTIMIFYR